MAAPAIVLVARGDGDPAVDAALTSITERLSQLRPDLDVNLGFLGGGEPGVIEVVEGLAAGHTTEIAVIPLDLVSAADHSPVVARARDAIREAHSLVNIVIARPIGPATELLSAVDERLRDSLHKANAVEVDALVLAAPEGGDVRGQGLLARRARQWSAHHRLPVQLAVNDVTGRGTAQAIAALRGQGRRHIAVGSLFLTPGPIYRGQALAAQRAGAIAVSDVIGADPRIVELALARYAFAAMDLLDSEPLEPLGPDEPFPS